MELSIVLDFVKESWHFLLVIAASVYGITNWVLKYYQIQKLKLEIEALTS